MSISVLRAVYASNQKGLDVTALCQDMVNSGQTVLAIDNHGFTDPDPGQAKRFMISFLSPGLNGGQPICLACPENTQLNLALAPEPALKSAKQPPLAAADGALWRIAHATYGTSEFGLDVTALCQALANHSDNPLTLTPSNSAFGRDPAPGHQKTFVIQYVTGGQTLQCGALETETLTLHGLPPVEAPAPAPAPPTSASAITPFSNGKSFQLSWSDGKDQGVLQAPLAGSQLLVCKQASGPNTANHYWRQKHDGGRIYLLDAQGAPTRYCLDVTLAGPHQQDGAFPSANGCLVHLSEDTPQRQTQLWRISALANNAGYCLQNIGLSQALTAGPGAGPYVMDSGGSTAPGSVCKVWQHDPANPNQKWQLQEPEA